MKKGQLAKSIIIIVLSFVFLILAIVMTSAKQESYGGAGNKTNAKIENLTQAEKMLEVFNGNSSISKAATTYANYTSATAEVSSYGKMKYEYDYDGRSDDQKSNANVSFSRNMKMYVTEDAALYEISMNSNVSSSSIRMSSGSVISSSEQSTHVYIKMLYYVDSDCAMLRFENYMIDYNSKRKQNKDEKEDKNHMELNVKGLNKWIYFDRKKDTKYEDLLDSLLTVNDNNFAVMRLLGNYIDQPDFFNVNNNVYKMKKDKTLSFANALMRAQFNNSYYSSNYYDDGDEIGFEIDLSNSTAPIFTLTSKVDYNDEDIHESYNSNSDSYSSKTNYSGNGSDILCFKNINNTKIKMPDADSAMSIEEFSDLVTEE